MVTQTTMAKKQVRYGSKQYALEYRLVYQEEKGYGIEVLCQSGTTTEREQVFVKGTKRQVMDLVRLFAAETVFPIALKETLENFW